MPHVFPQPRPHLTLGPQALGHQYRDNMIILNYQGQEIRLEGNTIDMLCQYFNCEVGDLIERFPYDQLDLAVDAGEISEEEAAAQGAETMPLTDPSDREAAEIKLVRMEKGIRKELERIDTLRKSLGLKEDTDTQEPE